MDYGADQARAPFRMHLERDGRGRVVRKSEQVAGGEVRTLGYTYDQGGRLATVEGEYGPVEAYRYEDGLRVEARLAEPKFHMQHLHYQRMAGRAPRLVNLDNTWIAHDDNGFRFHIERDGSSGREQESFRYAPDYRLLKVRKNGLVIEFDHDQDGRRIAKYVNGQSKEQYAWLDLVRLAGFRSPAGEVRFHYLDGEHTLWAMTLNGQPFRIYSDQVGSVRAIADEQGRVVQEIRYCSFGRILEESTSDFPMPLGFAGGLHDRDVGWVRFGFRDYDPETGRFTAPDPMGYAAGDPDLYGYCLDDPVNNVDPVGLEYESCKGILGCTKAIGEGIGEAFDKGTKAAGKAIKDTVRTFAHDEGMHAGLKKAGEYAAAAAVAPAAIAAVGLVPEIIPAAVTFAATHPELVEGAADFIQGVFPGPPPPSAGGALGYGAGKIRDWMTND